MSGSVLRFGLLFFKYLEKSGGGKSWCPQRICVVTAIGKHKIPTWGNFTNQNDDNDTLTQPNTNVWACYVMYCQINDGRKKSSICTEQLHNINSSYSAYSIATQQCCLIPTSDTRKGWDRSNGARLVAGKDVGWFFHNFIWRHIRHGSGWLQTCRNDTASGPQKRCEITWFSNNVHIFEYIFARRSIAKYLFLQLCVCSWRIKNVDRSLSEWDLYTNDKYIHTLVLTWTDGACEIEY